ncbi:FAD-binding domain-containing protein [Lentinula aciculospora]|uniref:D-lactate dehydrogenase (cytochrome) n=1 Tax=Lentinula aciculospora TaxID=153920 RepID=A0A9W9DQJ1_9AGAR|nr:FAD-binding domain-containing protein [Lentinula aciculospora]
MQRKFSPSSLLTRAHGAQNWWSSGKRLRFSSTIPLNRTNSTSFFTARTTSFVIGSALIGGLLGYTLASWAQSSPLTPSSSPTKLQYGSAEDFDKAIEELKRIFSAEDTVSTDPEDVYNHGFSVNDYHPGISHSVVIYPSSTADVVKIVKIATKYRMPITAYSGATSLEGQFRGHSVGGICIDMSQMNRILEINEADSDLVCQPGVGWVEINDTLREKGKPRIPLFFPIDPAPSATLGGMISNGCSGTNAVKYGTSKGEWFLNVTVVLPSGEVIKTRRRSRKSSAGFDTTKLFIGAEGTLGIITEVTIRLTPVLPTTVAVVHFPDVRKATEAVRDVMNKGVGIQCVELLDNVFMHAVNNFGQSGRTWPVKDTLFFKLQGHNEASLIDSAKVVQAVVEKHGGFGFQLAKNDKEADDLWHDRKNAHYSGLALVPGSRPIATDVCVPVSRLPDLVYETKEDLGKLGLVAPIVGHVGDGNFHAQIMFTNDAELAVAKEAVERMVHRAIAMDGTCTGEHGVGIGKKQYLVEELGAGTVELMKTVKRALDPLGLFNPGKLYPDDDNSRTQ